MKYIVFCIVAIAAVSATSDSEATGNVLSDIHEDGSYSYQYDTSNGISGQEAGVGGVSAQGKASWIAPDGTPIAFTYIADENGYRAEGPFVPATPPHVLRLLEYLKEHAKYEEPVVTEGSVISSGGGGVGGGIGAEALKSLIGK